ncbi:MAG: rhomboid family intramembrane serine protease [Anaerolineae bacterium]
MFPIDDSDVREAGPGAVTIVLVIINIIAFLAEVLVFRFELRELVRQYGVVPMQILQGRRLYTLFTSLFLHGGWFHLFSNMLILWIFGDNVEAVLGKIPYILFYIAGGIAASMTHVLVNPGSSVPSIGASGAIGAIMGAYVVMFPESQVSVLLLFGFFFIIRRVTALLFLGLWFVMQFFSGIASLGIETAETGGIAVWAHVGGFLFGLLIGFLFKGKAEEMSLEQEERSPRRRRI